MSGQGMDVPTVAYLLPNADQAYIISGLKKESKVLIGRAGIRVPFLERMDKLYLVDVPTVAYLLPNDLKFFTSPAQYCPRYLRAW